MHRRIQNDTKTTRTDWLLNISDAGLETVRSYTQSVHLTSRSVQLFIRKCAQLNSEQMYNDYH